MRIVVTIQEALDKCMLGCWEELCKKVGLNPWCLNEGLANGDDEISMSEETAKEYGIFR